MSQKIFKYISHLEVEITPYLSNFSEELTNYQTDGHTRNSKLLGTSEPTSRECLQKKSERCLIQKVRDPHICLISVGKQQTTRRTHISEIHNYVELVCKHPRSVSRNVQKYISSRSGDNPIFV